MNIRILLKWPPAKAQKCAPTMSDSYLCSSRVIPADTTAAIYDVGDA